MNARAHDFADRLGRFFQANGLSPTSGRVMGQLLVSDPPEQTFDEIVEALQASRGMVSVATRQLVALGFVERFRPRGERKDRYRFHADAWTVILRQDLRTATELRELAEHGLRAVARTESPRARLREMRDFYAFLEASYAPVLERWARRRRRA